MLYCSNPHDNQVDTTIYVDATPAIQGLELHGSNSAVADIQPCRWSLLVGLIIIVALSTAAWFLSPKGENQT